jgi:hypothetical protein
MSRVYFHSLSDEAAELRGSERAHASFVVNQIALGLLHIDGYDREKQLREWLPQDHYLRRSQPGQFAQSYATAFFVGDGDLIVKDGQTINAWELALNTGIAVGNDTVRFMARLHAQCEIHGFIEGPNRKWFADIIREGRSTGLYRTDQGWEAVINALEVRDTEPMVMSYSVCDGFPNSDVGDWLPPWPEGVEHRWSALTPEQQREREARSEAWYELPRDEQWERSLKNIRTSRKWLELKPDHWADYRFGHNLTVWDLFETQRQEVRI